MAEQLIKIATLFRVAAAELRRLARGPIQSERDTIVAVEAYLHRNQVRTADAFPPDQCLETANLLEEFADKLQAISRPPRHQACSVGRGKDRRFLRAVASGRDQPVDSAWSGSARGSESCWFG